MVAPQQCSITLALPLPLAHKAVEASPSTASPPPLLHKADETPPPPPPSQADKIFTTGTAVVVSSVGSLTYRGQRKQFTTGGQPGKTSLELYQALTDIQCEKAEDKFGWVVPLC